MKKEILSENIRKSLSEVHLILQMLEPDLKSKISPKFIDFVNKNRKVDYVPKVDKTKTIEDQDFLDETYAFMAKIYIELYCKTNEEKIEFLKLLRKK